MSNSLSHALCGMVSPFAAKMGSRIPAFGTHTGNQTGLKAPEICRMASHITTPRGFSIYERGGTRVIEQSWFNILNLLLGLFGSLFPFGLLLFAFLFGHLDANWLAGSVVVIVLLTTGAMGSYFTTAVLLNRTFIELDDSELVVRYGPLPFGRPVRIKARRIKQLAFKVIPGKKGNLYVVTAVLAHPKERFDLIRGLQDEAHARFYTLQLKEWLMPESVEDSLHAVEKSGDPKEKSYRCPYCNSKQVGQGTRQSLVWTVVELFIGSASWNRNVTHAYACRDCGETWVDENAPTPAQGPLMWGLLAVFMLLCFAFLGILVLR